MLLYVYLQITKRWSMWLVGMVASAVYVYVFFNAKLYADACLYVYYVLASVYGMWCWRKGGGGADGIAVSRMSFKQGVLHAVATVALFALMRFVLARYTDSPVPTGDAFITALSMVGTYMLAKKLLEQWHVWIVANALSTALCFYKGLYLTSVLYVIFTVLSFYGLWRWRRDMGQTWQGDRENQQAPG